jgi:hypothetical protein
MVAMRRAIHRHYPDREAACVLLIGSTIVAQAMSKWPDRRVAETVNLALEEYGAPWRLVPRAWPDPENEP